MLYFLRNKETGELANLHFSAMDEYKMAVSIGSMGDVVYSSKTYLGALKVLSQSTDSNYSDSCSPNWDYKNFGETHEIVTWDIKEETALSGERFENILQMIDFKKCPAAFMIDIPEKTVEKITVDHTLVDNVEFPDKISYNYSGFFINYKDEKFNDLVGKIMFLGNDQYSLYYIHAMADEEIAKAYNLIGKKNHNVTLLLVSRVNN